MGKFPLLENLFKTTYFFKISLFLLLVFVNIIFPVYAFEDYVITTNGKLTDISVEDNSIIDVYPLITVMNDKNTLIVTPLKVGETRFCVLKNNKNICMFNVQVEENKTTINEVEGFEILSIDIPEEFDIVEEYLEIDEPPMFNAGNL